MEQAPTTAAPHSSRGEATSEPCWSSADGSRKWLATAAAGAGCYLTATAIWCGLASGASAPWIVGKWGHTAIVAVSLALVVALAPATAANQKKAVWWCGAILLEMVALVVVSDVAKIALPAAVHVVAGALETTGGLGVWLTLRGRTARSYIALILPFAVVVAAMSGVLIGLSRIVYSMNTLGLSSDWSPSSWGRSSFPPGWRLRSSRPMNGVHAARSIPW